MLPVLLCGGLFHGTSFAPEAVCRIVERAGTAMAMDEIEVSSSDIWSFRRENDDWVWERITAAGQSVARSRATFRDMDECVADATRHGYVPPQRETDR